jgi:hypothetical protein
LQQIYLFKLEALRCKKQIEKAQRKGRKVQKGQVKKEKNRKHRVILKIKNMLGRENKSFTSLTVMENEIKKSSWIAVSSKMNSKFQIKTDSDKCKTKLNALKKDFKAYKFIMDFCSGFGPNGPNNDQVWDDLIRANKNCKKFKRNMNFEYYDASDNLMSNSCFTGNMILSFDQLFTATNNNSKKKNLINYLPQRTTTARRKKQETLL